MIRSISSRRHPVVAEFRALAEQPDSSGRRLLLDGAHLVREALDSGLDFEVVAVAGSRITSDGEVSALVRDLLARAVDVVEASDPVLDAISPVRTASGIVAIASRQPVGVDEICAVRDACIVTAVDVQDPGNVGALLRTAEAGGATGMLTCGASASPFSWKAVRGSMGSTFRLPVAGALTAADAMARLKAHGVRLVATVPRGGLDPDVLDWRGAVSIVLGGEGPGLPPEVIGSCDERVSIPMSARVESLNVAAAGAILIYAARRKRTE